MQSRALPNVDGLQRSQPHVAGVLAQYGGHVGDRSDSEVDEKREINSEIKFGDVDQIPKSLIRKLLGI